MNAAASPCRPTGYRTATLRDHAVTFLESIPDHFGIDRVNLLRNSIGGYFGLVYALAHPVRVRKLVVVGAVTGLGRHAPILFRLLGVPGLNRLLAATVARPSVRYMKQLFALLVADMSHVTEDHLRIAYAQSVIPGAERSWLSIPEELTTIIGLSPLDYLFSGAQSTANTNSVCPGRPRQVLAPIDWRIGLQGHPGRADRGPPQCQPSLLDRSTEGLRPSDR
jgi:pimeloyl-ACP methyl ester carboxylesterase